MRFWQTGTLAVLAAALAGCGDDSTGPVFRLEIAVEGRLERSLVGQLLVTFEGEAVDDTAVTWTADPVEAVDFLPDGYVQFLSEGTVILSAEAEVSGNVEQGRDTIDVAVPPSIVFDLLRDGNRDIYAAALDGGDLTRLTELGADDLDPTASGGSVVFTSFRDGNAELYSVPVAGGAVQRLTDTAEDEIQPALCQSGLHLAYASDVSGVFKLWTANGDGTGAEAATPGFGSGGSIEGSPGWAPGGDRLAFMSTTNGTADIFDLVTDGSQPTELITGDDADVEPAWHPNGGEVAFVSNRSGDAEVWLYRIASQALVQLTNRPGSDGEPAWLPDGRLVFTSWVGGVPALRWLDPDEPDVVYEIVIDPGEARRASGVFD
jgi:TolB protein